MQWFNFTTPTLKPACKKINSTYVLYKAAMTITTNIVDTSITHKTLNNLEKKTTTNKQTKEVKLEQITKEKTS
jgi:hypothetical protein